MDTQQTVTSLTIDQAIAAVAKVGGDRLRDSAGSLAADTRIADLGFDSLDVAEIIVTLEESAGCELDVESVEPGATIGDLLSIRPL
jgi:acyl carrier protein